MFIFFRIQTCVDGLHVWISKERKLAMMSIVLIVWQMCLLWTHTLTPTATVPCAIWCHIVVNMWRIWHTSMMEHHFASRSCMCKGKNISFCLKHENKILICDFTTRMQSNTSTKQFMRMYAHIHAHVCAYSCYAPVLLRVSWPSCFMRYLNTCMQTVPWNTLIYTHKTSHAPQRCICFVCARACVSIMQYTFRCLMPKAHAVGWTYDWCSVQHKYLLCYMYTHIYIKAMLWPSNCMQGHDNMYVCM